MKVSRDDIHWLQQLVLDAEAQIPSFELSRLRVFGFVDDSNGSAVLTTKGEETLAEFLGERLQVTA